MDLCLVQECSKLKTCLTVLSQILQQTMSQIRDCCITVCLYELYSFTFMSCLVYYSIHDGC